MSKTKKMTFNMIAAALHKESEVVEVKLPEAEDIVLTVRRTLQMKDAMGFVQDVAASCIDLDAASYTPEAFDFAMRINVLTRYAGVEAPKDLAKAYRIVYETGVFDAVFDEINHDQFDILIAAVHERIGYAQGLMTSAAVHKVDELVGKMDEMVETSTDVMERAGSSEFRSMLESFVKMQGAAENSAEAPVQDESGVIMMPRRKE